MTDELYNKAREWFLSFIDKTTQKKVATEHIKQKLAEHGISPGSVIELGVGAGDSLIPILKALEKPVKCSVVEPNAGMLLLFIANYIKENFPAELLQVCSPEELNQHADLLVSSHSLYYIPDWNKVIADSYQRLNPGGLGFFTLTNCNGFLYMFRERFFPATGMQELGETRPHSGDDLCRALDCLGIGYERAELKSETDITRCLDGDTRVLSFFLRTGFDSLDAGLQQEVLRWTRDNSAVQDGRVYAPFIDDAVWIKKAGKLVVQDKGRYFSSNLKLGTLIADVGTYLKKAVEDDMAGIPAEARDAYIQAVVMNHFFSYPELRLLAYSRYNDPRYVFTKIGKNGKRQPNKEALADLRITGRGLDNKYELARFRKDLGEGKTEQIAAGWLADLTETLYYALPPEQQRQYESPAGFRRWIDETYARNEHQLIFSPYGRGLLGCLQR